MTANSICPVPPRTMEGPHSLGGQETGLVEHAIVSEDALVSDSGTRGHMVTCSCGETIKVSVDLQHPATAARNLAYDQWSVHKRDTGSI